MRSEGDNKKDFSNLTQVTEDQNGRIEVKKNANSAAVEDRK